MQFSGRFHIFPTGDFILQMVLDSVAIGAVMRHQVDDEDSAPEKRGVDSALLVHYLGFYTITLQGVEQNRGYRLNLPAFPYAIAGDIEGAQSQGGYAYEHQPGYHGSGPCLPLPQYRHV